MIDFYTLDDIMRQYKDVNYALSGLGDTPRWLQDMIDTERRNLLMRTKRQLEDQLEDLGIVIPEDNDGTV